MSLFDAIGGFLDDVGGFADSVGDIVSSPIFGGGGQPTITAGGAGGGVPYSPIFPTPIYAPASDTAPPATAPASSTSSSALFVGALVVALLVLK